MSKFNETNTKTTKNKEGNKAYSMSDKELLMSQVLTTFFNESKFYGDNSKEIVANATKVILNGGEKFVSNLARYARKEMHLRSISHVLTCIVANNVTSKHYTKITVQDVVERPDDITEILACYLNMFGKPIPNALKKALATAMNKFDAYGFKKYNGGNKTIKFKDVLKLTHAKPKDSTQEKIFNQILNDNLPAIKTWQTEVSAKGNKEETWEDLIENNKLGYMASLRNLRNIVKTNPQNVDKVYNLLTNKEAVLKSKQLPFRFFVAYKELQNLQNAGTKVFDTLETAIEYSVENMQKIPGTTVIAIDTSGSMNSRISENSEIICCDIARLLAVLATKVCDNAIIYTFNSHLRKQPISTKSGIIETAMKIPFDGGSTYLQLPLQEMINNRIKADRLITISDNMINFNWSNTCEHLAAEYRRKVNSELWVHAIDLQGYGTQQFDGARTNIIAGWSEKVLDFISLAETDRAKQVEMIENYGVETVSK
jgi:precorrin-6B methylase 2